MIMFRMMMMIIIMTMIIIVCISSQYHYHQWMMAPRICKERGREKNFTWYFRPSCIIRFFFFLFCCCCSTLTIFKKHHLSHTIIHIEIFTNSISSPLLLFAHATPFFFSFILSLNVCLFVCHQSILWIIIMNEWMNEWCTLHLIPTNIRFIFTFIHSVSA